MDANNVPAPVVAPQPAPTVQPEPIATAGGKKAAPVAASPAPSPVAAVPAPVAQPVSYETQEEDLTYEQAPPPSSGYQPIDLRTLAPTTVETTTTSQTFASSTSLSTYRCTIGDIYPEGHPAKEDLSSRQAFYIRADSSGGAIAEMQKSYPQFKDIECTFMA